MNPDECRHCSWFNPDAIFIVTGYSRNDSGEKIYKTNTLFNSDSPSSKIHPKFTMSDEKCIILDRKSKLLCLNSIQ